MAVEVTYVQDNFLTSDVLNEMVLRRHRYIISERCQTCYQSVFVRLFVCFCVQMLLVDYYRGAPDLIHFSQYWCPDTTMLDKIKVGRLVLATHQMILSPVVCVCVCSQYNYFTAPD